MRDNKNAKKEFIETVRGYKVNSAILYKLLINYDTWKEIKIGYILKQWYTKEEYLNFLDSINFKYDSWYWGQELFWYIFCDDWVWFDRWEYDGSEWRECNEYPNVEKILKKWVEYFD